MNLNPEVVLKTFQEVVNFRPSLDKLEACVICCVFYKSIEKLLVLKELLSGLEKKDQIGYSSLLLRMTTRVKITPPGEEKSEEQILSSKIKRQISFLFDVLEETVNELLSQGSYVYLEYTVCCENLTLFDNIRVQQKNEDYKWIISNLQEVIKLNKGKFKQTQNYLLESTGPCLDKAYVNTYTEDNLKRIYSRIKEQTRVENNFFKLKENEHVLKQTTKKVESETEEESRIHYELQNHLGLLTTELVNKFELWSRNYNNEVEKLDIDLLQLKSKRDEQSEDLEKIKKLVSEKEEILHSLQAIVEEYEWNSEVKTLENRAATKIQRWWRNHLFKKKLLKKIISKNLISKKQDKKKKFKK